MALSFGQIKANHDAMGLVPNLKTMVAQVTHFIVRH